ncbi:hypothetical protein F4604DRAFT_1933505 [Suillus subluteus]|nr:hypothetical protein F4604DRAFT_1933505 [Suillus subluteus]
MSLYTGCIILWYLPDAISLWIQAEMEDATIGMGSLLMKSMTSGLDTQWRTFPGNFHASDRHQLTPGCINLAPCWFMQGQEPHGSPPADGFTPEVLATLKGKGGPEIIISMQRTTLLASAALRVMHPKLYWASVATHIKLAQWARLAFEQAHMGTFRTFSRLMTIGLHCTTCTIIHMTSTMSSVDSTYHTQLSRETRHRRDTFPHNAQHSRARALRAFSRLSALRRASSKSIHPSSNQSLGMSLFII